MSERSSMDQEGFFNGDQLYVCKFFSYREVWYINMYVLWETNPIFWSKLLIDIILRVRKILHVSGGFLNADNNYFFVLQRSVIYQFVCTLWEKSNGVIVITYEHHPWNQEYPPWIRKGSWKMTISNFEVKRSVIYHFVCTLQDKFNGVVKSTYGHLPWYKEISLFIRKGS